MLLAASAAAAQPANAPPAARARPPKAVAPAPAKPDRAAPGLTPLGDRVATMAALDKLTGETRAFTMRPGDQVQFGRLTIRLAACETTPPWDPRPETGAFAQVFERAARGAQVQRVFSGWLFANSPGLHPFENDAYDVWVRSCAMRFPETGPETVAAGSLGGGEGERGGSPRASRAKKSAPRVTAVDNSAL